MQCGLSLSLKQELRLGIELFGGVTSQNCFVNVENMLLQTKYQKGLKYIYNFTKKASAYNSVIDCIFGESFPSWKFKIKLYYKGDGCLLIDDPDITDKALKRYDRFLCLILEVAHMHHLGKERAKWSNILETAKYLQMAA